MRKTTLSRAEELARISQEETDQFLEDKVSAENERSAQIANLKALRLAKEAKERKATKKLARAVLNK
ncbi:hypothetical protein RYZ26_17080 [Terasakiella sp. A23]|uniref:hypothetical protein n=1 Tax=Terasakiella sp. FCG-A23 TaxID=3080561 RepID=UPI00295502AC|nr:hypothetical protein [Terasakiella sp. A23]MDV7341326.1 hypothetical protein [Terasakiella sp. A23]